MARPRIPVGSHGEVSYRVLGRRKVRALCQVRDADGRLRQVTREGTSKADARQNLLDALADRPGFAHAAFTGDSTLGDAARLWLADIDRQIGEGNRAPNTARVYRSALSRHVLPALGELRLREATVPRVDAFLLGMRVHHGAAVTTTTRKVLSGIFGYAVRQGALSVNPIRDVTRIRGAPTRAPRALTQGERDDWLTRLEADEVAVWHDLPDLTRIMLATGVRIGECLALGFGDSVDVDDKLMRVDWKIERITGVGLVRSPRPKSAAGARTLRLPGWAVDVLLRRGDTLGWTGPVFPAVTTRQGGIRDRRGGGWRDPSNTSRSFREARDRAGYDWVTSHVFRKTVATVMDEAGMTAREIADQLGHTRPSMTQDVYMGRRTVGDAVALEGMFGGDESVE